MISIVAPTQSSTCNKTDDFILFILKKNHTSKLYFIYFISTFFGFDVFTSNAYLYLSSIYCLSFGSRKKVSTSSRV